MADKQGIPILSEADAAAERAKLRAALKLEFQKKLTHPFRHGHGEGGYLFDPAVQRFMSMKVSNYDHFKVTPKTSYYGFLYLLVPFFGLAYYFKTTRDAREKLFRTGQVAYKDRQFKFT